MKTYELALKGFCENCPHFQVDVREIMMSKREPEHHVNFNRIITCKHMNVCRNIFKNMRKMYEEKEW